MSGPVRGAQPERTRLAWRRTALAATVAGLLTARLALVRGATPTGAVALAVAVLCWLTLLVVAQRRIGRLAGGPVGGPRRWAPVLAATAVLAYAVLGALLVVLHTG